MPGFRIQNVFDSLTEWILDDSQWSEEQLAENKHILMDGVIADSANRTDCSAAT